MMDINVSANDDIYNIINSFFKETKINSDFYVERKEEQEEQKKNSDEKKEPDNSWLKRKYDHNLLCEFPYS